MALFTPVWKKSDVNKAYKYVRTCKDQTLLEKIAIEAPHSLIRSLAVENLTNDEALGRIVMHESARKEKELMIKAVNKIKNPAVLVGIVRDHPDEEIVLSAIGQINSQPALVDIAIKRFGTDTGNKALSRITNRSMWANAAIRSDQPLIRIEGVKALDDHRELIRIARNDPEKDVRDAAEKRMEASDIAAKIAKETANKGIGIAAVQRVDDPVELKTLVTSARLYEVRAEALQKLPDNTDKQALAPYIIPDKIERTTPQIAAQLNNCNDLLKKIALRAEQIDTVVAAVDRIKGEYQLTSLINKLQELPDGEERLEAIVERTTNAQAKKIAAKPYKRLQHKNAQIRRERQIEENERLAEIAFHNNDPYALDKITDPAVIADTLQKIKTEPDAPDRLSKILRLTKNETVKKMTKQFYQEALGDIRFVVINRLNGSYDRYKAALKLFEMHCDISGDDELIAALSDLIDTYARVLNSYNNDINNISRIRFAIDILRNLYKNASDSKVKDLIRNVPQKTYVPHHDAHSLSCYSEHSDIASVTFTLY